MFIGSDGGGFIIPIDYDYAQWRGA
ncbi:hypothetical protein C349_04902 [Cryptococcus neoformans var. grubii Br795]|nr:hypothetical protein C353_04870 [Cryptococcus neoformans var. grubii AD1-83a]OXG53844.1 hypothetical protein C354_04804 [Cryptococcus neoformans var. grubii MW-RSA1955]OXG57307.1 hypothetical protein C352_04786 [Cryptococcus neoformans var. grubii CHC193]OXG76224.1 hypothetical protein C350_04752 [Cryptococcus neoformans var. grubii MW-RSA36]OXG78111.1 hypothetical protein C349_04902 [Cryptococcus neoformans var. grubii Br795]OXH07730.1 hypothetical protein C370_04921 [Cryptococcus neoforma